ncbi:SDR family NAD(P)-dependent oxidoreductase, partial [Algoriphagus aestuarii]|nr:SDR family NAD(P)-dependent oxidoreductase [Algoriphagus aestuarii]
GVKAVYSGADMTKPAEIAQMIAEAEKAFGSVDVLVNNAGIQHVAPVEEFPRTGPSHARPAPWGGNGMRRTSPR